MRPPGDEVNAGGGGGCHIMEEEEDGEEVEVRKGQHMPVQLYEEEEGHGDSAAASPSSSGDSDEDAVMRDCEGDEKHREEDEGEGEQRRHRLQQQKLDSSKKRPTQGHGDGSKKVILMWGYLPGVSPQRAPLLSPTPLNLPDHFGGDSWKESCGGGCGFAMAISERGKLITWGSTDDLGQSYVTSGKHEEIPEPFPLPNGASVVKASAGWAHCISVTDKGEVYAWGWKECVPSPKSPADQNSEKPQDKENAESQNSSSSDQVGSPTAQALKSSGNSKTEQSNFDNKNNDDNTKRRKITSTKNSANKQTSENSAACEESLSAPPCLLTIGSGVKISVVAAGGRHTLALSDSGQVWGWGYGGEGQLGLGTRIRTVSAPHLIPCTESTKHDKATSKRNTDSDACLNKVAGNNVKAIACGGRHSVVVTDIGELLTFGWGLYGQCGQGGTDDELSPTCVSSLLGIQIQGIAAGLWHTVCTSTDGVVYVFGGNQFGQLGTGTDQYETLPKLLEAPCLEEKNVRIVSCGARHTAAYTDDGKVFSWGWNKYGQLGLGDAIDRSIPTEVPVEGFHPKDVSCGWWHTVSLAEPNQEKSDLAPLVQN